MGNFISDEDRSNSRRLEIHRGPDSLGRYGYSIYWLDDYFPGHPGGEYKVRERGQNFFGKLPEWYKGDRNEYSARD